MEQFPRCQHVAKHIIAQFINLPDFDDLSASSGTILSFFQECFHLT